MTRDETSRSAAEQLPWRARKTPRFLGVAGLLMAAGLQECSDNVGSVVQGMQKCQRIAVDFSESHVSVSPVFDGDGVAYKEGKSETSAHIVLRGYDSDDGRVHGREETAEAIGLAVSFALGEHRAEDLTRVTMTVTSSNPPGSTTCTPWEK